MEIAVHTFDGMAMFHLATPLLVFGEVSRLGLAEDWEARVFTETGLPPTAKTPDSIARRSRATFDSFTPRTFRWTESRSQDRARRRWRQPPQREALAQSSQLKSDAC